MSTGLKGVRVEPAETHRVDTRAQIAGDQARDDGKVLGKTVVRIVDGIVALLRRRVDGTGIGERLVCNRADEGDLFPERSSWNVGGVEDGAVLGYPLVG